MSDQKYILITGGLGYIGSHVAVELLNSGYKIIIIDNLFNSKLSNLEEIKKITHQKDILFYETDIRDENKLTEIFLTYQVNLVIHMAGLKAVSESIKIPIDYYDNNVVGTLKLLSVMKKSNCKRIIFSSSATVYGDQKYPVNEEAETGKGLTSPYGKTKYMIEQILNDVYLSDNNWQIIILRYFNPVGNHVSGLLKENPNGLPNNLFPYIIRTARHVQDHLPIFGNDYDTPDGTCLRDFIHVVDLAKGHIAPIEKITKNGLYIYNLGTGKGTSVLELVENFIKINQINLKYQFAPRREGDLPIICASVEKAYNELQWKADKSIDDICIDGWKPYIGEN